MNTVQRHIDLEEIYSCTTLADRIRFLIQLAATAPSTHNSQPWQFTITGQSCQISYNPERQLNEADPTRRDLYISLGCALENLVLAAQQYGLYEGIRFDTQDPIVAEVFFYDRPATQPMHRELCESMLRRHNARGLFTGELPSPSFLEKVEKIAHEYAVFGIRLRLCKSRFEIETLAKLTAKGIEIARSRPLFRKEFSQWFRPNISRRRDGIPGYAVGLPTVLSFIAPFVMRYWSLSAVLVKKNIESMRTAPLVFLFESDRNDAETWLQTGRLAERLMLECYVHGLATSIYVAAIEMGQIAEEIIERFKLNGHPQFLFTCGYSRSPQTRLTPRIPVDAILKK